MSERKQVVRASRSRITGPPRGARDTSSRAALEHKCARLERLCATLRERAELAEQGEQELLSVVSHDLRNPLSVILVSSRLMMRTCAPDAPARKQLEAVARAADEINLMVQDLVDAASIQAGRLAVGAEAHEAELLLDKALEAVQPIASAKPLEITKRVDEALPPVLCDRERIVQVVTNLVSNAVRFTPKGGKIAVSAQSADGEALFSISDTGPGIAREDQTLVFVRRENGKRQISQGTGLAVFVARGIVEAHGGRMWIESRVGEGSTFYFTLPTAERQTRAVPRDRESVRRFA
jgi:signal transduction histidine kinase